MLKKKMLMMKLRAVQQGAGDDVVAGYEPEGDMVEAVHQTMVRCLSEIKR